MGYGIGGYLAISKQNSVGTATSGFDYVPFVSESLTENIEQLQSESLKAVYDQPNQLEGINNVSGDIVFEPHNFKQLINHKLDIVSGLYLCQKTPGIYDIPQEYACVDLDGKRFNRFEYEGTKELKEVRANGMGWMLVKKKCV